MAQFVDLSGENPIFEGLSRGLASLPAALQQRKRLKESMEGLRPQFPEYTEEQLRGIAQLDPRSRAKMIEGQQDRAAASDLTQAEQAAQAPPQIGNEQTAPFVQPDERGQTQQNPEQLSQLFNSLKQNESLNEEGRSLVDQLQNYFGDVAQAQNPQTPEQPQFKPATDQTPNNNLTKEKIPTPALELSDYLERDPQLQKYERQIQQKERAKENAKTLKGRESLDKQIDRLEKQRDKRQNVLTKQHDSSLEQYNKFLDKNQDYITNIEKGADSAIEDQGTLNQMEELNNKGNLDSKAYTNFLENIEKGAKGYLKPLAGLITSVTGGLSPDSEKFQNLSKSFIKNAKEVFGGRITDTDLNQFMDTIPTLLQSQEGRSEIINRMKMLNEAKTAKSEILDDIRKENYGTLPKDFKSQLRKRYKEQLNDISRNFKRKSRADRSRIQRKQEETPVQSAFERGILPGLSQVGEEAAKGYESAMESDAFRNLSEEEAGNLMQNLSQNTGGGALSGLLRALGPEGEADPMERVNYAEQQRQRNIPTPEQYINRLNRRQRI